MSILGFCSFHKFFGSREVFVDKEKVAGATRMVVEIDGRWDPKTLYTRIKSAGLPIQGVKPVDYGRCALSFDSWFTD